MPSYGQSFLEWSYVELPTDRARLLIQQLVDAGAGFAHTSEPWNGLRRIYFFSETSSHIVEAFVEGDPD